VIGAAPLVVRVSAVLTIVLPEADRAYFEAAAVVQRSVPTQQGQASDGELATMEYLCARDAARLASPTTGHNLVGPSS